MRKFKFFTDVHEFGCYAMDCVWEFGKDCYYLGDNVDLACCSYEDVKKAKKRLRFFKKKFGKRYISGNHELEKANVLKVGKVLMAHGDYIFWPKVQADNYRARKPGINAFLQFVVWLTVGKVLATRSWGISRLARHRAFKLAKQHGCHTVVCGHWHPKELQDITHKGVRIVVLPRGKTEIEL